MKKQLQILLVLVITTTVSYAQRLQPNTVIKGVDKTFKVDTIWSSRSLTIWNVDNTFRSRKPQLTPLNDPVKLKKEA